MREYNPYAPPIDDGGPSSGGSGGGAEVWQEGGRVVLAKHGGELPDRCVVCNRPTSYKLRKTFTWHSQGLYFLVFLGWLIYLIVALIVRKSATVYLGLCEEHQTRRKNGLLVAWIGFGASFVLMFVGAAGGSGGVLVAGILGMIVLPIAGGLTARVATPTKIDDMYIWLRAGAPFVDSLPRSPND